MNISALEIYLVCLVDSLVRVFAISIALSIIAFLLLSCYIYTEIEDKGYEYVNERVKIWHRRSAYIAIVSIILCALTPNSKTIAAMYVVPALAKSELVSKDIPDAGKAIIKLATKWAEDKLTCGEYAKESEQ